MSWVVGKRRVNSGTSGAEFREYWLYVSRGRFQAGWGVGGADPYCVGPTSDLKTFSSKEAARRWLIGAELQGRPGMTNTSAETITIKRYRP